jgi:hypothetical protein
MSLMNKIYAQVQEKKKKKKVNKNGNANRLALQFPIMRV